MSDEDQDSVLKARVDPVLDAHKDKVGYRRPPRQHRFQKGKSGNPGGRRPKSNNIDTLFKEELGRTIAIKRPDGTIRNVTKREAIVMRVVEGALKGNHRQLEFIVKYLRSLGEPDPFQLLAADDAELTRLLKQVGNAEDGNGKG
jgi:hypothetical protein